ncbi:MAG TPA: hypothetical protein VNX01_04705 [Bacteroidia bacterium]|jgi:hypothetical protein|nr:hypothetical protein [Bacteroidia bacterium]
MANNCDPFDITFTGTKDDLFEKMKDAASANKLNLIVEENDASSGTIIIKKFILKVAAAIYKINGQLITFTVTQLPPGQSCEDIKNSINKFINPPSPEA